MKCMCVHTYVHTCVQYVRIWYVRICNVLHICAVRTYVHTYSVYSVCSMYKNTYIHMYTFMESYHAPTYTGALITAELCCEPVVLTYFSSLPLSFLPVSSLLFSSPPPLPASPLPHPFGDSRHSPQSPQSPTFALPALRSVSLSPQPPGHRPMQSHSSSSSLLDGSKTVPRP